MPTPPPVCLSCRRPLAPEPDGDLVLRLDGSDFAAAVRELAKDDPAEDAQSLVREAMLGLCRTCGRPL